MSRALHSGNFRDLFYLNTRLLSRKLCSQRLFPFGNEKEVAFTPLPAPPPPLPFNIMDTGYSYKTDILRGPR